MPQNQKRPVAGQGERSAVRLSWSDSPQHTLSFRRPQGRQLLLRTVISDDGHHQGWEVAHA